MLISEIDSNIKEINKNIYFYFIKNKFLRLLSLIRDVRKEACDHVSLKSVTVTKEACNKKEFEIDGDILEAKIAALIDEYEEKHSPMQVEVVTRWRNPTQRYYNSIGGSAQLHFYSLPSSSGEKQVCEVYGFTTPTKEIIMSE